MMEQEPTAEKLKVRPLRIAVMGAMGSGKSKLALLLGKRWGEEPIEERFADNRFLSDFYKDPKQCGISFKSQIHFLSTGSRQLMVVSNNPIEIFDAPIINDRFIFAETLHKRGWMDEREMEAYLKLYRIIVQDLGIVMPDFYIAVTAPAEVLLERILKERGRDFEHREFFEKFPNYLPSQVTAVSEWVKETVVECPVVVVDSANNNYVDNPEDRERVLGQIENEIKSFLSENPCGKDGTQFIIPDFLKVK